MSNVNVLSNPSFTELALSFITLGIRDIRGWMGAQSYSPKFNNELANVNWTASLIEI